MQLRLNTRANARRSLARLTRDLAAAPVDDDPEVGRLLIDRYKALVYGTQVLLQFDKAADADAILERLAALEARGASR